MKTPEEIKKWLECCISIRNGECEKYAACEQCPFFTKNMSDSDALAYIQQLEAQIPKWISVDNPPKYTSNYLVYVWVAYPDGIAYMDVRTGVYNIVYKTWTIPHSNLEAVGEPTHWMPLPEPPKEG